MAYYTDLSLINACWHSDMGKVKECLARSVRIDTKISVGTALHVACSRGNIQIVKLLLANGACLYANDDCGLVPLDHASRLLRAFSRYPQDTSTMYTSQRREVIQYIQSLQLYTVLYNPFGRDVARDLTNQRV